MLRDEAKKILICEESENMNQNHGLATGSKLKETLLILAILFVILLGVCVDTMPMTFFNYEAKKRGLKEYQTGIVLGCYDFGRFFAGPLCPLVVKKITAKKSMILGAATCGVASVLFELTAYIKQPVSLFVLFSVMQTVSGAGAILLNVSCTAILMQSKSYSNATMFMVGFNFSFMVLGAIVCFFALPRIFCVPNIGVFLKCSLTLKIYDHPSEIPIVCLSSAFCAVWKQFDVPISTWSLYFAGSPVMYVIGNFVASLITNRGYIYSTILAAAPAYILCYIFLYPSPLLVPLFNNNHYLAMTVTLFRVRSFFETHLLVPVYQALVNLALVNGHGSDSVNTYAVISSAVNFSWALGAMLGFPLTGTVTQYIGLSWAATIIAFIDIAVITNLATFLIIMKILGKPLKGIIT